MPLSTKQMEYLAIAWACFETEPKIDYEKFRELAGLKTAHSARELMRVTKNKLKAEYGPLSDGVQARNSKTTSQTTPSKPTSAKKTATSEKKTTGRKRAPEAAATAAENDATSPTKKARADSVNDDGAVKEEPDFGTGLPDDLDWI